MIYTYLQYSILVRAFNRCLMFDMQNDTLCGKDAKDGLHIFSKLKDGIFLKERKYMLLTN